MTPAGSRVAPNRHARPDRSDQCAVDRLIIILVLAFGIYAFITLTGVQARWMSRKSKRTAESMYGSFVGSLGKQRRYAREHGGEWQADDATGPPRGPGRGWPASRAGDAPSPAGLLGPRTPQAPGPLRNSWPCDPRGKLLGRRSAAQRP